MNIFYLDNDPAKAAAYACDVHTVSQPKEAVQMLSTVSLGLGGVSPPKLDGKPYKATHAHHPCTIWAGLTIDNWQWLHEHAQSLCTQYAIRYKKVHPATHALNFIWECAKRPTAKGFTPPAQAMPEKYRGTDPVTAYRDFYRGEKVWQKRTDGKMVRLARWERGVAAPEWWTT